MTSLFTSLALMVGMSSVATASETILAQCTPVKAGAGNDYKIDIVAGDTNDFSTYKILRWGTPIKGVAPIRMEVNGNFVFGTPKLDDYAGGSNQTTYTIDLQNGLGAVALAHCHERNCPGVAWISILKCTKN